MAVYTEIHLRRDSTLNWYAANPRLALGEPGVDMTLHRFKIGNGIDRWNELPYMDDDLYKLLDEQSQAAADKAQELLNLINANKLDADTKHNAVTTELRQTSRELNERMTSVEREQVEYEEVLTAEFEDTRADVDAGLEEFAETRDQLSIRMDVIAGQTTEDTEILDARVDADYQTHPNLGANIRNIHTLLKETAQRSAEDKAELDDEIAELKADDNVEKTARIAGDEAEKAERIAADEAERVSRAEAVETERAERIAGHEEHESVLLRLSDSSEKLRAHDEFLQEQINANAEGLLRTELLLHDEIENARDEARRLDDEEAAREEKDRELEEAVEAEEAARERACDELDEYIRAVDNSLTEGLEHEAERITQAEAEIQARAEEIADEIAERERSDQEHTARENELANSIYENTAKTREQILLRGDHLQAQIDQNAGGLINEIFKRREENKEVRQLIADAENTAYNLVNEERAERVSSDDNLSYGVSTAMRLAHERADHLQAQVDETAGELLRANIQNWQKTQELDTEDQKLHEEITETEGRLRTEVNETASSIRQELDDNAERLVRNQVSITEHLQEQINQNAQTNLQHSLELFADAEKHRELKKAIASIKSPIDWSSAESLAIPEPRCAVVNFTGLSSMPTSKTADIPAVMEFWDRQGNYFKKNILCSAQGSSSLGYVKKNVKFDLLNEDGSEFDLKIGNWVVQDGFHLKAYYTDFFRGVGVTSYKLWEEIMQTKPHKKALVDVQGMTPTANGAGNVSDLSLQIDTGALCHPDGFPCIVYLNGEFYGVFSWQIKKQRKNYHMDKSTIEHIHIDGSLSTANFWNGVINWGAFEIRNPNKLYTMDGKKYDGDAPKELIDETSEKYNPENKDHVRSVQVKTYIQDLVRRFGVLKASPSRELYEQLFDWENQRDYLIFSDVIKNSDGFAKNWQWTTYDGVKWFVNAYDLDMSFGGHWQGIEITPPLTGHIVSGSALPTGYMTMLYQSELEARYKELRDAGIIDVEHIVSKLADWTARIGQSNYALEYERWPNSPCILNYNDSVDRVRKWLTVEIANMDKVYNYVPVTLEGVAEEINSKHEEDVKRLEDAGRVLANIRYDNDAGLQEQIDQLAGMKIQEILTQYEERQASKAEKAREAEQREIKDQKLQDQSTQLSEAVMRTLLTIYHMWGKMLARFSIIEEALVDGGLLDESDIPPATDMEIENMIDDIFSGSIPEEEETLDDDDKEFDEMLDEAFGD